MPDPFHLFLFVAAGWLLNLTPGLDVLYIVTHSLRGGWRKGFVASLGITAGCFVHVFAAALGIGAVLSASATAFTVLKWVGTCYLVWIGIRTLLATKPKDEATPTTVAQALPSQSLARIFLGGFWTNDLALKKRIPC